MKWNVTLWLLLLLCFVVVWGCGDDDDDDDTDDLYDDEELPNCEDDDDDAGDDDAIDDDDSAPPCDDTLRPLVFAHGFIENGDAFSLQEQRFTSNGYCADRIFAYDWDTIITAYNGEPDRLNTFIDAVLEQTGADQVDLMGHSMGGGLGTMYLDVEAYRAKVAHYAHLASFSYEDYTADVPTLVISSDGDTVAGIAELPGATNLVLEGLDHLQVATSETTFKELYPFFTDGQQPEFTEPVPEAHPVLSGRTLVIGTNWIAAGIRIDAYEFDPDTGMRIDDEPAGSFVSDASGNWGSFVADADAYYEFVVSEPTGTLPPVRYFREPFVRSTSKLHFRVLPAADNILGKIVAWLPLINDEVSIFAYLNLNQAMIYGRDTLTLNGDNLIVEPESDWSQTIAIFFLDANFNGQSDHEIAGGFLGTLPFIQFFDLRIDAEEDVPLTFVNNGRTMTIPNFKTRSEGLGIVMFD